MEHTRASVYQLTGVPCHVLVYTVRLRRASMKDRTQRPMKINIRIAMTDLSDHRILPLDRMAREYGSKLGQSSSRTKKSKQSDHRRKMHRVFRLPGSRATTPQISSSSPNSGRNKRRQAHHPSAEITGNSEDKENDTKADRRVCHALPIIRLLFWTRVASRCHRPAVDTLLSGRRAGQLHTVRTAHSRRTVPRMPQRDESQRETVGRKRAIYVDRRRIRASGESGPSR